MKFEKEDDGKKAMLIKTGEWGKIEYPLHDASGNAMDGDAILWLDFERKNGTGWIYVRRDAVAFGKGNLVHKGKILASKAMAIALEVLEPFKESGQIYEDYKEHSGFTDEQYQEMIDKLREMLAKEEATKEESKEFQPGDYVFGKCYSHGLKRFVDTDCIYRVALVIGDFLGIAESLYVGMPLGDVTLLPASRFERLSVEVVEEQKKTKVWKKLDGTVVKEESL